MKVIQADTSHLPILAPLFDGYRQFYEQCSDMNLAESFLRERIEKQESVIFLALDNGGHGLGFTQLYPTFSSVSAQSSWILNDLYVADHARKQGVGAALMDAAKQMAASKGAKGILLETGNDNSQAQRLYERLGYQTVDDVRFYFLKT